MNAMWKVENDTITSEDGDIARLHYQSSRDSVGEDFQRRARMIAAAPMLLRLVREYRHELRSHGWGCDSLDGIASSVINSIDNGGAT
jgi:hypothetical protein